MKKFLITAAACVLLTTAAHAASKVNGVTLYNLHQGKYWSTFATIDDKPKSGNSPYQCAVQTEGSTTSKFYIKWTPSYGLRVQLWKRGWQIEEDTNVKFTLDVFDDAKPDNNKTLTVDHSWTVPAGTYGTSVFASIREDQAVDFMQSFREADRLVVNFPEGDEPAWNMRGEGTRKAGEEFAKCVAFMRKTIGGGTASTTSPVGPKATSPTSPAKPTSPVQPTDDRKRVKKDDGSV